jgi:hypothetical protein
MLISSPTLLLGADDQSADICQPFNNRPFVGRSAVDRIKTISVQQIQQAAVSPTRKSIFLKCTLGHPMHAFLGAL